MARATAATPRSAPVARRLAGVFAGGLLALGLLGGGLAALGDMERQAQLRAATEREAALLADRLAGHVAERRALLAGLAAAPALRAALEAGDREALNALLEGYERALPGTQRLLLAPAGTLEPDRDARPPIGYALVDLVERAQANGEPALEAHLPGTADAHVNLVQPLPADIGAGGVLVLSYGTDTLRELLTPPGEASLRLDQNGTELLAVGDAGGLRAQRTVAGTPWRLTYALPGAAALPLGLSAGAWSALAGGALLLLGLATWLGGRGLRRQLLADGEAVTRLVHDAWADRIQPPYRAGIAELDQALQDGVAISRETDRGGVAAAPEPGREPASAPAAAPDNGLEVSEVTEEADTARNDGFGADAAGTGGGTTVSPAILRTYDIRGIVDRDLTPEVMRLLGRALGSEAAAHGQTAVVVGYDGRASSPELAEALRDGLGASGCEVIDIGRVPTPVMYFATHFLGTHAGVAVTGSHNPPEYNGLKMIIGGRTLWGDAIQALGRRIESGDLIEGDGREQRRDVFPDYLDRIARDVTLHRPLRVVVDCGNGVAGAVAPEVFRALGCEVEELYCEVDGRFPNHHPDPTVPENLEALVRYVRLQEADVGLAFDGDGDRLGVVDNAGHIIWADRQMMLYAREVLTRNPGADIIFDVKCSSRLAEVITDHAGVPLMWKTGHSLIKEKLSETGAPLAGEMSGHLFFNDRWYGFDDATYAGARLLEILSLESRSSAEVFAELPEGVSTPEIRVDLEEGEPHRLIDRLLADVQEFEDARVTTIDGLRVDFPDGWGLVRASNTQPCLVMRFEGNDEAALERIKGLFRERIEAASPGIRLPV